MQKKLIAIVCCILIQSVAFSKNISQQQAILAGKNFFYERLSLVSSIDYKTLETESVFPRTVDDQILFYTITFKNKGFVVVSSNDIFRPVLCYVFDSRYDMQNLPPAFVRWMEDYEKQMLYVLQNHPLQNTSVAAEWDRLLTAAPQQLIMSKETTAVPPLLKTTWNQDKYYNNFCPPAAGGPDGRAYAGCVPTAMGQIMNYYRHPVTGIGSYVYNDTVGPLVYDSLAADFGNTVYRWDQMPLAVTERQNDSAVAKLLYHLGVSVNLNYDSSGSGMYNHKAAYALRTYFGYAPDCQYIFRDTATHTNWKQLILNHLNAKKPLYYAGWADTINVSGHAFVCDGYQDTSYFHFNWGWGGSADGYFLLDNLTPGGSDFTLDHELIINFYPDTASAYHHPCNNITTLTKTKGTFSDGSGPLHNYQDNADCLWIIEPADSIINIKLSFLEFDTEQDSDIVIVYKGNNTSGPVLGTFTGSTLPQQITATGKALCVRFISNNSVTSSGFLASYTCTLPVYCTVAIVDLTAAAGTFEDGSGTYLYHPNQFCRWRIKPAGATAITLHFNAFDITPGDYVRVTDLEDNTLIAELTGSVIPDDIICNSGQILVQLKTFDKVMAQGFSISYYNSSNLNEIPHTEFSVSPNPAKDLLTLTFQNGQQEEYALKIFSVEGRLLFEKAFRLSPGQQNQVIDVSMLQPGFYLLHIASGNVNSTKKIIIE
ncbi:MAG TPA: C10 family peptidase [Bacteroidales bacterium]|mgnify:CR=1 FL=1|jgi:hypothetical protein|nr:C10 family peptidase [Bacteroidales bacterium]HPB25517.1 C10 family peptidase [Bacteroidales bacterium]HPI30199.1 C10 family peptidase [Bacteroidales bacterium]HQN16124.1 C10 family peptidase [Bacteroidales bacterium]HQP15609.1 C10 family peptidase [Bacteroidales bacterium]